MTDNVSLNSLQDFMTKATEANANANVLVASGDDPQLHFQRLTLATPLSKEFLDNMRLAVNNDYEFHKYEPGFKPDSDELCYLPLSDSKQIKDVIDGVSKFEDAQLFTEEESFIESLRFYGVIVENQKQQAIFFREFSRKKELTRAGWIPIISEKGTYGRFEKKVFLFDEDVDCFAWDANLFIRSVSAFQRIFGYFEAMIKKAEQTIPSIVARVPISNLQDFTDACKANPLMLAKLAQIAKKPYLQTITMVDIKRVIADFGIDVKIITEGGIEKLVFEANPARRWNILKVLDDDYLNSLMTKLKYESNSKTQV